MYVYIYIYIYIYTYIYIYIYIYITYLCIQTTLLYIPTSIDSRQMRLVGPRGGRNALYEEFAGLAETRLAQNRLDNLFK